MHNSTATSDPSSRLGTPFGELLDLLGVTETERVSICSQTPGGAFQTAVPLTRRDAEQLATSTPLVDDRNVWFGVNPVRLPEGYRGRGTDDHVTRCVALFADIDIKPDGVSDVDIAQTVAKEIAAALHQNPAAVVFTGNGGHTYWTLDPDDPAWTLDTEVKRLDAITIYRRFHRLCSRIADSYGGRVDNVGQISRILRVPGSVNRKNIPVPVELHVAPFGPAAPLSRSEVTECLDAYGIPEEDGDRGTLGEILSHHEGWQFGSQTAPYVASMIDGWGRDTPPARNPWMFSQAIRLSCAHRLGRITGTDYDKALGTLEERFEWLLAHRDPRRAARAGEFTGAVGRAQRMAEAKTDAEAAEEVGGVDLPREADRDGLEADIAKRMQLLMVDREARRRIDEREATGIVLPPVTGLRHLLARDDDPVRMRVDRVWPAGGAKILCAAPAGGGKTTMSGNLMRSLVDGDPFLDVFTVHQPVRRAVMVDNEMTEGMTRRWLRRQGIRNLDAVVDVVLLRGNAGLFNLGNDRLREMWARRLRDLGCDFLILDCLSPVITAMGLKEATELGKFLDPLTNLMTEAGVGDVLVHHHMGHDAERARGDSTALGWSDANWKITRDGDARYFATDKVRDAEELVPEGLLSFDAGRLTYAGGDRAATRRDEGVERRLSEILDILADHQTDGGQGMNTTAIGRTVGGKKETTQAALRLGESRNKFTVRRRGRSVIYQIAPQATDPMTDGHVDVFPDEGAIDRREA
ncbi:MAG: AAA family ATPase [Gemmatimonadetes bacterium]|nr:AAA family ATPase [Gemmatimonadota bacterium]